VRDAVYVVASPPDQDKTLTLVSNLTPYWAETIDDAVGYGFAWDDDHIFFFPEVREQRPRYDLVKAPRL
jgi:hypothetical protein